LLNEHLKILIILIIFITILKLSFCFRIIYVHAFYTKREIPVLVSRALDFVNKKI